MMTDSEELLLYVSILMFSAMMVVGMMIIMSRRDGE